MNDFILDCSVTMAWCFSDEANKLSDIALDLLQGNKAIVPSIWPIEVVNVLYVAERKNRMTSAQTTTFLGLLNVLPIEVDSGLMNIVDKHLLELSRKFHLSAYDAAYIELALRRDLPLVSFDKALCLAATKAGVEIL